MQLDKVDFSKFVGRNLGNLALLGDRIMFKTLNIKDGFEFSYDNTFRDYYDKPLNYETVKLCDCKPGDLIFTGSVKENMYIWDFKIIVKVLDNQVSTQYLDINNMINVSHIFNPNLLVIRFKRC